MPWQFLNEDNFYYLTSGLTLDDKDLEVLDAVLEAFDKKTGLPSHIASHNKIYGYESTIDFKDPQILINLDKMLDGSGKFLRTASVGQFQDAQNQPAMLHINLHSPSLDIPQRIEIPLRYLIKGGLPLKGTYMVYLHALEINDDEQYVYYGITKRGWMKRFMEHVKLSLKGSSKRKFPQLMGEATKKNPNARRLTGTHNEVCATGRNASNAHQIEKYLIEKHSLYEVNGLNMKKGTTI